MKRNINSNLFNTTMNSKPKNSKAEVKHQVQHGPPTRFWFATEEGFASMDRGRAKELGLCE